MLWLRNPAKTVKEYGNSVSFTGGPTPDPRMVAIAQRQLEMDYASHAAPLGLPVDFPGMQTGPVVEAHEPCPADLDSHEFCPLCEGSCQGDIIPGKFVHSYGWYVVVP